MQVPSTCSAAGQPDHSSDVLPGPVGQTITPAPRAADGSSDAFPEEANLQQGAAQQNVSVLPVGLQEILTGLSGLGPEALGHAFGAAPVHIPEQTSQSSAAEGQGEMAGSDSQLPGSTGVVAMDISFEFPGRPPLCILQLHSGYMISSE